MLTLLHLPECRIRRGLPLLFYFFLSGAYAQQSPVLEAYIRQAVGNNISLRQQDIEIGKASEAVRQSKALSGLNFTLEANYTLAAGGRKLDFPVGDLLNPVYGTLNQLTQTNAFPQVENVEIQFLPNNFQETKVSVAYPLYNSDLKYNRAIQSQLLNSKTAFKSAQEQTLRYEVTKSYLQYIQTREAEKVWRNAREVLLELRRFNESLVRNNVATRDVVATAEYELGKAENEIVNYQSKARSAAAYFNYLLNKDLQADIEIDSTLLTGEVPAYDLQELLASTLDRRAEFSAIQSMLEAADLNVKRQKANQKLPDLYAGGSVGFQGYGYKFNREQAYAVAQVGLSYKLFDNGFQQSKTQETRLEYRLAAEQLQQAQQQVAVELSAAWNELEAARYAFQISQKNVDAAQAIFKIVNNRYRAGQALLLEFLDAQNRVTSAQLQRTLSWIELLLKEAALKKAAGIRS